VLRVIREILFFEPHSRGTDMVRALDFANQVTRRRAIMFLLSDFELPNQDRALAEVRRAIRLASRRHDLVALHVHDLREAELPDVGQLALEDAESGDLIELDTTDERVRRRFAELAQQRVNNLRRALAGERVEALNLDTRKPYEPALRSFFKNRERRMR